MIAAPNRHADKPSPEVGDGENRNGGISWGHEASTPPSKRQYAVSNDNVSTLIEPGCFGVQPAEIGRAHTRCRLEP
jgi:hypothetical protein